MDVDAVTGIGRRYIVFYEKAALALGATALTFALAGQPVARGLDLAMLGVGTFLAFGRIGCFNVACCHGRRAGWGVRYGWDHAGNVPQRWVGVTLFPVQLIDGGISALAVALGTALVLAGLSPGSGLAGYLTVYSAGRFVLELFRGDDVRRICAGLSEAQWTSVTAALAVTAYRPAWWTVATASALAIAAAALRTARRHDWWPSIWLMSAGHLAELDRALDQLVANGPAVTTSERLRMQLTALPDAHFELSLTRDGEPLPRRLVQRLTRQLGRRWSMTALRPKVIIIARVAAEDLIS